MLAHTSKFCLCFMSVCLMKSNCYSLIYTSLDLYVPHILRLEHKHEKVGMKPPHLRNNFQIPKNVLFIFSKYCHVLDFCINCSKMACVIAMTYLGIKINIVNNCWCGSYKLGHSFKIIKLNWLMNLAIFQQPVDKRCPGQGALYQTWKICLYLIFTCEAGLR